MVTRYDAIVIGTGQAGPSLAARLSGAGQKVAVVERSLVGGTCVNTGCIPTKTMIASAYVAHMARRAVGAESMLSGNEQAAVKKSDDSAVKQILTDLARRDVDLNRERSSVLARSVIDFMGNATNLMDNPDRNAAFVVLKTARVPAILLELGYVTNAVDAQQQKSDEWRDTVSGSLVTAIDNYLASNLARLPM